MKSFSSSTPPLLLFSLLLLLLLPSRTKSLDEETRLREYHARNYTWPLRPNDFVPSTEGWISLCRRRLRQIEQVEDSGARYNGWVQSMTSAVVAPNFTEYGWGMTRAPQDLVDKLKEKLHSGLPKARAEHKIEVIEGYTHRPYFVPNDELNEKILRELKPMHEEWSGVSLVGAKAYGLRAYRNQSSLLMHIDRPLTHIISSILHIDHSDDSEPWPLVIEDFHGNTNEVLLESGDMLFYESSKAFHGRPTTFKGSWYSSLFVHYYPVGWDTAKRDMESHYAIPSHWNVRMPSTEDVDDLVVVGTALKEPSCLPDSWCGLKNSVKWRGPAVEGVVATTGYDPNNKQTWKEMAEECRLGSKSEEEL